MPRIFFSAAALALAAATATFSPAAVAGEPAQRIDQESLLQRMATSDPDLVFLDVRTAEEYSSGHIAGAINIAYDLLPERGAELEAAKDKDIVLYCRSGRRTAIAADTLRAQGFKRLWHLDGDMLAWEAAKRPVVKGAADPGAPERETAK